MMVVCNIDYEVGMNQFYVSGDFLSVLFFSVLRHQLFCGIPSPQLFCGIPSPLIYIYLRIKKKSLYKYPSMSTLSLHVSSCNFFSSRSKTAVHPPDKYSHGNFSVHATPFRPLRILSIKYYNTTHCLGFHSVMTYLLRELRTMDILKLRLCISNTMNVPSNIEKWAKQNSLNKLGIRKI